MADKRAGQQSQHRNVVIPFPSSRTRPSAEYPSGPLVRIGTSFEFRLRNGYAGRAIVSDREAERLWMRVQQPDDFHQVIVFDSQKRRVALSLKDVVATQFDNMDEGGLQGAWIDDGDETVNIIFPDSKEPVAIDVDPDAMTLDEFDNANIGDNDLAQLASLFVYFEMAHTGSDDVERLRDSDGSMFWLRINDIPFCSAPLSLFAKKKPRRKKSAAPKKK